MEKGKSSQSQWVMTAKEVCLHLRLPISTVYDLALSGRLPATKCGKQWRFLRSDVDAYLKGNDSQTIVSKSDERRCSPRIKSEINSQINGLINGAKLRVSPAIISNICKDGAYVECEGPLCDSDQKPLEVGDPVLLRFSLVEISSVELEVKGRIVHASLNGCAGYGIKFRLMSPLEQEVIKDYVG